jgi:hypothetical protein
MKAIRNLPEEVKWIAAIAVDENDKLVCNYDSDIEEENDEKFKNKWILSETPFYSCR